LNPLQVIDILDNYNVRVRIIEGDGGIFLTVPIITAVFLNLASRVSSPLSRVFVHSGRDARWAILEATRTKCGIFHKEIPAELKELEKDSQNSYTPGPLQAFGFIAAGLCQGKPSADVTEPARNRRRKLAYEFRPDIHKSNPRPEHKLTATVGLEDA
jgi:hypothetical protein